ncbi:extracellular solute-binding protein [Paenibacillus hemerocallicola]|uniref:Extracellular solute-binding protein n=1 Tax=Paenibacillus hemerocallicola TaxID=1172614 RepID=A0A5C4T8X2_9BACL|nr:extracellular solute-binding protein [Paenibacillus hemerocallicola]TNJ65196.1 extracellular solute-binding protein [Paenibacillus hemerocallicola]
MAEKPSRKTFRVRLDEMVDLLREEIWSGKLGVDKYLPSEAELGKQFQLSNNSVRKGLDVLVQEGLIEKIPKVGNRVVSPTPDTNTVVRFGYHGTIAMETGIERLLEKFHKRYPHIQVQTLKVPTYNYFSFYKEYMEANLLDIFTMNDYNFGVLLEHDAVDLLEPVETDADHYPFLTEPFMAGGEQLVQPLIFTPLILCYNKEHFLENDLPEPDSGWTWDKLFRVAERLAVVNERYGFYYHMLARNRWPLFLLQSGMKFEKDERGLYKLDCDKLMEGLDVCKSLLEMENVFPSMLSASNADAEELFLQQKVSMIITSYSALNELKDADFPFDIAPLPSLRDFRTLMIVIGLAINHKSKVKEAAKLLGDFLRSYDSQLGIHRHTLSIPANKRAAEWTGEEKLSRPSRYYLYREIIPTFRLASELKLSSNELSAVYREAKLYWSGLYDRPTVCRNIERALNAPKPLIAAEQVRES